jgi:SAM-dependent methyltransferase
MEHNHYHDRIIGMLTENVEPGWRVLDIGSGNGALSLPLCAIGCEVTALGTVNRDAEPARWRSICPGNGLAADRCADWEQVPLHSYRKLDLITACNSLHLTEQGLAPSLNRIFQFKPRQVFLVSELYPGLGELPARGFYVAVY